MTQATKELVKGVGSFFGHVAAIIAGLVLSVVGLAMGVTIVMLPVGIPLCVLGLALVVWGVIGYAKEPKAPVKFPGQPQGQP
jgi:hypothetical protein